MAKHSDQQLAHALAHDAGLLCDGGTGPKEVAHIRDLLFVAELLLGEKATDEDRSKAYAIVHPSTRSPYLS